MRGKNENSNLLCNQKRHNKGMCRNVKKTVTGCDFVQCGDGQSRFDCIIVGGPIRMGKLYKPAAQFISANRDVLMEKKCAFFICNGFPEQAEAFLVQNIDKELLTHSVCAASFGGKMDLDKLKGMDKFIAKAVGNTMKNNPDAVPKILTDNIKQFADALNQA